MIYIGIDPGKSGGITFLQRPIEVYPMPSTEQAIANLIKTALIKTPHIPREPVKAIIEAVHAFPGQGVTSMFTFGQNYGFLRGCLVALSIPFIEVTPQKWMAYFGLKKNKEEAPRDYKKRILQKAQNLFPQSNVNLQTADSLMLCEYLRLTDRS